MYSDDTLLTWEMHGIKMYFSILPRVTRAKKIDTKWSQQVSLYFWVVEHSLVWNWLRVLSITWRAYYNGMKTASSLLFFDTVGHLSKDKPKQSKNLWFFLKINEPFWAARGSGKPYIYCFFLLLLCPSLDPIFFGLSSIPQGLILPEGPYLICAKSSLIWPKA